MVICRMALKVVWMLVASVVVAAVAVVMIDADGDAGCDNTEQKQENREKEGNRMNNSSPCDCHGDVIIGRGFGGDDGDVADGVFADHFCLCRPP